MNVLSQISRSSSASQSCSWSSDFVGDRRLDRWAAFLQLAEQYSASDRAAMNCLPHDSKAHVFVVTDKFTVSWRMGRPPNSLSAPRSLSGPHSWSGGPRSCQACCSRSARRRNSSARRRSPSRIASSQGEGELSTFSAELSTKSVGGGPLNCGVSLVCGVTMAGYSWFWGCCGWVSSDKMAARPLRISSFPRILPPTSTSSTGGAIGS